MNTINLTKEKGRIKINLASNLFGEDLCISITGGEAPHIGALSFGSMTEKTRTYAFESHKEGIVTETLSSILKENFSHKFVIVCGIHIDNACPEEIEDVMIMCRELIEELIRLLKF